MSGYYTDGLAIFVNSIDHGDNETEDSMCVNIM